MRTNDRLDRGVHRARGRVLAIRALARMRLAEEYGTAQDRGPGRYGQPDP